MRAAASSGRGRAIGAGGLMIASGAVGLGYQIVWTQQCTLWLGHEASAVLAVTTAFFAGTALGSATIGSRVERSRHPARWYAGCELLIGAWSLALAALLGPVSDAMLRMIGAQPSPAWQWAVCFGGAFLLLLPATAAMGATLPAMARLAGLPGSRGRTVAGLYACNTLGATAGVLVAAFWLVPAVGLAATASLCAALNLLCAAGALALVRGAADAPSDRTAAVKASSATGARRSALQFALTGLLGIAYEVVVVRVLSQVNENTVYTFAILIAVYLVGTALGAAAWRAWSNRRPAAALAASDVLGWTLALVCLVGSLVLHAAPQIKQGTQGVVGPGMAGALCAEAAVAFAVFLPATLVMGMLFSALSAQALVTGLGLGRALAANTLGAAAAPLLFGVGIAPLVGPQRAIAAIAAGYLLTSAPRRWTHPALLTIGLAAVACATWVPALVFVDVPEGGRVVSYREGPVASVSVVEDAFGVSRLRIDNRQQEGSSSSLLADSRQALLPLLLHGAPKRALFLGLGTGMTSGSAAADPTLEVQAVELLPDVITAAAHFAPALDRGTPGGGAAARLHPIAADARRFVRTTAVAYDVIVADNFHPARSGSGALYTVEHFNAVRERLAPGGEFCQWLPLHQLDIETLRSIVASFIAVYPGAWAMLATNSLETPVLGLVARRGDDRFDLRALRARLADNGLPQHLADLGLADEFSVLGGFVAGPSALARLAAGAPLNTDDRPVVAYLAPRTTYAPESLPRDRLLALLHRVDLRPDELVVHAPDGAWAARLAAYWSARDRFIEVGRDMVPKQNAAEMLAQVHAPLMSVLRLSPDFRPAYDPLLRMALALAPDDELAARALLQELAAVQPERPEAREALRLAP